MFKYLVILCKFLDYFFPTLLSIILPIETMSISIHHQNRFFSICRDMKRLVWKK
ncbi:unnamed protein product [Haemonchus placei]|uniref:Uncharacterized protein n=1 Tax=Haemonchus placei TaxID=6290 RepID=A0A3P7XPG3_HAEPC|nr:unnamed protein product [Haemonchus placei]